MKKRNVILSIAAIAGLGLIDGETVLSSRAACAAQLLTSYAEDIAPIFRERCVSCHSQGGEGYQASGLDLSTYAGLMKGTKYGPVIEPGNPDTSNLMWLLDWRASPQLRMPHGRKKLSICDRNTIRAWISEGAKDN